MASTGPSGPWDASDDSSNYDIPRSRPPPRPRRSTLRVSHLGPSASRRTPFSQPHPRHNPVTLESRSTKKGILRHRGMENEHVAERVEDLAASLQATSEVLSTADRMLEHYRDINVEQDDEIAKLRFELEKSAELLRHERSSRRRRLPVTPSTSQSEEELSRSTRRGSVRFRDDAKDEVDELRHALRDLKSEQNRLTGELERQREDREREKQGRHRSDGRRYKDSEGIQDPRAETLDRERLLRELQETEEASRRQAEIFVKGLDAERSVLQESQRIASDRDRELESLRQQLQAAQRSQQDDVEKRLQEIQHEMRAERQMWEAKQKEVGELTSELRNVRTLLNDAADNKRKEDIHAVASVLENERRALGESQYEKRILQSRVDDLVSRLEASERERQQVMAELDAAVKRIDQTEGGKSALVEQAEDLRRRLSQSDQEKAQLCRQLENYKLKQEENEAAHKRLQARFEALRREVEEGDGDKERLLEQLEVLRGQVAQSEQEKEQIGQQIARITGGTGQRRQSLGPSGPAASGGRRGLRRTSSVGAYDASSKGLRHTAAGGDVENIRRNLDQMHRDRGVNFEPGRTLHQPSSNGVDFYDSGDDGIDSRDLIANLEMLNKDVDRREEQQERLIQQMQNILGKYDRSEEQKKKLASELEVTVKQLKDSKMELEQLGAHLNDRERELDESEKKRSELKDKALKTIKEYRSKCKKLEKDAQDGKEAMAHNERLDRELRELRSLASSGGVGTSFMGTSRRDMDEMMDQRNRLNEELARKNSEIRELQAVRYSSEKDLRDAKDRLEKLENEVRTQQAQLASANLEKLKMEESLQAAKLERRQDVEKLESSQKHHEEVEGDLRSTVEEQKREIKELRGKLNRLGGKLQDEVINRQTFEERMAEVREQGRIAKDEAGSLYAQLQQEREAHTNGLRELQEQIQTLTASHEQAMQEMSRKSKHETTELENQLAEMKVNLADEKSTIKALRKRQDKDREEIERLTSELNINNEENTKLRSKYQQVRDDLENTKNRVESGQTRVKDLEESFKRSQFSLEKMSEENLAGLQKLDDNLDRMIDVMCKDTGTPLPSLLASGSARNDSRQFIADMMGKIRWLSEEIKIRVANERRLREQTEWSQNRIRDLITKADEDKTYFISELDKQSLLLEELATQKKGLESKYRQNTDEHRMLKDRIRQLTNHLETSTRALHATAEALDDKQKVLDELDNLKGEKMERDRIHDRYVRYKEKVGSLRRELQGAKSQAEDFKQESLDASTLSSRLFENLDRIASPKTKHRRLQTPDTSQSNVRPSQSTNEGLGVTDWSPSSDSAISATTEDHSFATPPYKPEKKRQNKTSDRRTSGRISVDDLDYKERFTTRTPRVGRLIEGERD